MHKRTLAHLALIAVMTVSIGFFDLPNSTQQNLVPSLAESFQNQSINLGLDLQGGAQLDYKIDLRKVEEADREQIIEGVMEVITRRVNGLGVAEPNIYRSNVADEEHIVVEMAGIQDLETAKATVGKTIQLEFKEENENPELDAEEYAEIQATAQAALDEILEGADFDIVVEQETLANPTQVLEFSGEDNYRFADEIPEEYFPYLDELEPGDVIPELLETSDGYTVNAYGEAVPMEGFFIAKLTDKREGEQTYHEDKEVEATHLLIAYEGAERASVDITRTKAEAETRAQEAYERAIAGEDFSSLVAEYSDEAAAVNTGGELGFFGPNDGFAEPFRDAAFGMEIGEISEVVETQFGFHVILVTDIKEAINEVNPEMEYSLQRLYFSTLGDPYQDTGLTGEHFVHAGVEYTQTLQPYVTIEFNEEGAELFEEITERNIGKQVAIFVGGDIVSAPRVNAKISGGYAIIESQDFTTETASDLARELNTGAIPAPIVLVGQYTIGASLGQDALASSLQAGMLGLILLMTYMVLYYRIPGLLANLALGIYAILLMFFIKVAMPLGIALVLAFGIFSALVYVIFINKESGGEKMISSLLACFILFFLTYLLATPVVLTLAGIAGVILSIGMAVDANILIFERMREELRNGRPLSGAIEVGFDRAWSSIRDSNFSSLITCAILMYFGSSIIQGFAVNLAIGILISMFTAITITRTFLRALSRSRIGKNAFLMGIPKKPHPRLPIVQNRRIWFGLSGFLVAAALVVIPMKGLNLGMDFTGGTLMELQFEEPVATEDVQEQLALLEEELLANGITPEVTSEADSTSDTEETVDAETEGDDLLLEETTEDIQITAAPDTNEIEIDFGEPIVISVDSEEGHTILVRMKHISSETHDAIISRFQDEFGSFEETRYTTVGPTIGASMKSKAVIALSIALVMIVFYIAFAFRSIPKHLSAWRFGWSAIAALVHDILITLGVFVILGSVLGIEIDALFITALLTIMGFSVHDTIVTFDRVRENVHHQKSGESFEVVANRAVNETLARSVNTSISTLFTIATLFFLGADSIHWFLLALIVGLIAGTYSSIFTATPILVAWNKRKEKEQ